MASVSRLTPAAHITAAGTQAAEAGALNNHTPASTITPLIPSTAPPLSECVPRLVARTVPDACPGTRPVSRRARHRFQQFPRPPQRPYFDRAIRALAARLGTKGYARRNS